MEFSKPEEWSGYRLSFSGDPQPRGQAQVSCIADGPLPIAGVTSDLVMMGHPGDSTTRRHTCPVAISTTDPQSFRFSASFLSPPHTIFTFMV